MIPQPIRKEDSFESIEQWANFLESQMEQYWNGDVWYKPECPIPNWDVFSPKKPITYNSNSTLINTELKFGISKNIISGNWQKKHSWKRIRIAIPVICKWLNEYYEDLESLTELPFPELINSCKIYLIEKDLYRTSLNKRINASLEKTERSRESSPTLTTLRTIFKELEVTYDVFYQVDPFTKDVWDLVKLNASGIKVSKNKSLNFTLIRQSWLKEVLKKYFKTILYKDSADSCVRKMVIMRKLSYFLDDCYPGIRPHQINRETIVDLLAYIKADDASASTIHKTLCVLNKFFGHPQIDSWLNCNLPRHLIYPEDYPKMKKTTPRFLPKEIEDQLKTNVDGLRQDVMRMVLVLSETGRRASEILYMPFDCLIENNNHYFLRHPQFKMNNENSIPISNELANVVLEQQQTVIEEWGNNFPYLFPGETDFSNGKPLSYTTFNQHLKQLVVDRDIRDKHGKLYNITLHQFRHSVGTSMVNNGVPLHIVQRYLGHTSPEMTLKYAHIFDETLRKEIDNFHKNKTIDITGQMVLLEVEGDSRDLEWFTKEISAIALPNGYCGRPKVMGDCDIAGDVGCYLCPFFRTNKAFLAVHKDQLERIDRVLAKAYRSSWKLPIKKNEPIKQNLELIISTLEADDSEQA